MNNKILILEGGYNEEHKVSLKSSKEIQKILNKINIKYKILRVNPKNFKNKILKYKKYIVFNALHGPFGEDGQVQKILKKNKIKFTHSNVQSSKNCFNKFITKKLVIKNNILTPKFIIIKKKNINVEKLYELKEKFIKFVLKPVKSGSSFGIVIIKNNLEFKKFIKRIEIFKSDLFEYDEVMVEEYILGKELTVSTIKFAKKTHALAITEIKCKNKFFDYQAKYSKGYSKHILPAKIDKKKYNECMNLAVRLHNLLKCNSIARSDFILNNVNNKIYFLETNTQPGLTSVSLFPEQAEYKNISFKDIVTGILKKTN